MKTKFRVWDKLHKKWSKRLFVIDQNGELLVHAWPDDSWTKAKLKHIPVFFTGVKDKNGVEIYEGDIIYIAGYGNYEAEFPFIELYESQPEGDIGAILGNVHENPELLK